MPNLWLYNSNFVFSKINKKVDFSTFFLLFHPIRHPLIPLSRTSFALTGVMGATGVIAPNHPSSRHPSISSIQTIASIPNLTALTFPAAGIGFTALTALNPHPTIPFVNPLIRKSVNPLTIGAICAIGATTIIPPIAYRPYRLYWRYSPYSP